MRKWLEAVLNSDPRLSVVGEASDPHEAREVIKQTNPDVITLDVEMPRMNGLEFLEKVMRLRPMPVVMISSRTRAGSAAAVQALSLGAVSCVWKPEDPANIDAADICDQVFVAANAEVRGTSHDLSGHLQSAHETAGLNKTGRAILVGASTGGVAAIETLLSGMPVTAPPIIIAQHMPSQFLNSFSSRLDGMLPHQVRMAADGEALRRGQVRLAPSCELQTGVIKSASGWKTVLEEPGGYEQYNPSVEHLFRSAVQYAKDVMAVMLTGLGNDGSQSMKTLRDGGAMTFGQNEDSCVVYGMPKAAYEIGALQEQVSIDQMAKRLVERISSREEA